MLFKTGEQFPLSNYRSYEEGAVVVTNESLFDVLFLMRGLKGSEVNALRKGAFKYGLFVKENIPIWVFDFGDFSLDAAFNFYGVDEDNRQDWLEADANAVTLFGVEQSDYVLKSMRLIGFDPSVIAQFKRVASYQLAHYPDAQSVENAIDLLLGKYTTASMIRQTAMFTISKKVL